MLATFRKSLNTWPARLLFGLLVVAFAVWGIGDVVRNIGRGGAPIRVAGQRIDLAELQPAYQRNLAEAQRKLGNSDPTPELRRSVAIQTVEQMVTQSALSAEARRLGLVVPDDALRRAVFAMPAFQNKQGQFDRAQMDALLRNNGLTEARFLEMMRQQLLQQQVLQSVSAGAAASDEMAKQVYAFQHEKRVADAVTLPFADAPAPPAPTEAQLRRWWENHPDRYSTPEYRRIKAIVLSPETVAKDVQVSDEELKAAWDQHKGEFNTPERRSVEVILTQDETEAQRLAATWQSGADWAAMQQAAERAGAAPVDLSDATRGEFPGEVPPPVHTALGWYVLKVTKVTPGKQESFEQARDALRKRVALEKAADVIYDRANRIDNLLSSGSTLDNLPGDLGVAAVAGTLDADGKTPSGQPAPIPGPAPLRQALIAAAFQEKPGDPPKLTQAPNAPDGAQSFFAVSVESIEAPKLRPFDQVQQTVRADWTGAQVKREQEATAANLMHAVNSGKSLADAAAALGLKVERLPPAGRDAPVAGVPPALVTPLFSLRKRGEATMAETSQGFVVAALAEIQDPDPKADPIGWGAVRDALGQAVGGDEQEIFAVAVRDRSNPYVNPSVIESLAGSGE